MTEVPLFIWINFLVLTIAAGAAFIRVRRENEAALARYADQATERLAEGPS
jgi:hypothetical protein